MPKYLQECPEFNTMSQNLGIDPILDRMNVFAQTDEIYIDGFAYKIPDIILDKYALKINNGIYHKRDEWVENYKNKRQYKFRDSKQRSDAKRLAEKKKMFTKLRYL